MKLKPVTTLVAFSLICGAGFLIGRWSAVGTVMPSASASPPKGPSRTASNAVNQQQAGGVRKASRVRDEITAEESRTATHKIVSLLRDENALDRNRALLKILDGGNPKDFNEVGILIAGLDLTEERSAELTLLLTAWAQADPLAALKFAEQFKLKNSAQSTILSVWATKDPETAIRWAKANFKGEGANPYLAGIIQGIGQTDRKLAASLLTGMPRSAERGEALDAMLPHFYGQGLNETRSWISSLTDDSLRNGAIERVTDKFAESDPAGTAAWLISQPGQASKQRMDDVYSIWVRKDKQAALTSFNDLPTGEIRTSALRGIVNNMASKDAKEAIGLMDRNPGDVTDRVVQSFIWHSAESDTAAAASQIARLKDERRRNQMYRRLLSNWLERDPPAAKTWLANNPLADDIRVELNNRQ